MKQSSEQFCEHCPKRLFEPLKVLLRNLSGELSNELSDELSDELSICVMRFTGHRFPGVLLLLYIAGVSFAAVLNAAILALSR